LEDLKIYYKKIDIIFRTLDLNACIYRSWSRSSRLW